MTKKSLIAPVLACVLLLAACTPPAWFSVAESIVKEIVPIAGSIIDIVDPAVAPLVTIAENAFNALAKAIDDYIKAPNATALQAVQAAFDVVNANEAQLSAAAQIKDPKTDATLAAIVNLLDQGVDQLISLIPPSAQTAKMKARMVGIPDKHWNGNDFKKSYNDLVKGDSRFKKL